MLKIFLEGLPTKLSFIFFTHSIPSCVSLKNNIIFWVKSLYIEREAVVETMNVYAYSLGYAMVWACIISSHSIRVVKENYFVKRTSSHHHTSQYTHLRYIAISLSGKRKAREGSRMWGKVNCEWFVVPWESCLAAVMMMMVLVKGKMKVTYYY